MANSYLDKDGLLYFLQKIRANATPSMDGTASTGTAKRFALQDHVHPSDTSKAPLASPALTGTPTAPTAATGTSTTQIATTEFVANTVGAMTSGVSDVKVGGTSVVTNGVANINGSETAASGGTTLSMVTTGEKYTWNNKASNSVFSPPQSQQGSGSKGLVPAPPAGSYNARNTTVVTAGGDWSRLTLGTQTSTQGADMQAIGLTFNHLSGGSTTTTCTPANATTSMNGFMSAADKTKLNNISGLTLDIVAGSNVTVTPDTTNGTLTIAATDTKDTAGSASSTSKLYLVGARAQASNAQTFSRATAYIDTDGHLYSNSKQTVNLSDTQALTNKTYNGYTLGAACAKGVVTSISADSADVPTVTAVKNYISTAITGAASFQGTAPTTFAPTNYKKGWYWVVGTAGTYVGEVCEAGDMIFAVEDYSSAYSASDFSVIQTNLDITSITNAEIDTIVAS